VAELNKLADLSPNLQATPISQVDAPRALRRRLEPERIAEIVAKYQAGATTPALCTKYLLSKGGLLKLLREEGAQLRNQSLSVEQVMKAASMYEGGLSIAKIANYFGVSYSGVRQAFVRAGIQRRARGGSTERSVQESREVDDDLKTRIRGRRAH